MFYWLVLFGTRIKYGRIQNVNILYSSQLTVWHIPVWMYIFPESINRQRTCPWHTPCDHLTFSVAFYWSASASKGHALAALRPSHHLSSLWEARSRHVSLTPRGKENWECDPEPHLLTPLNRNHAQKQSAASQRSAHIPRSPFISALCYSLFWPSYAQKWRKSSRAFRSQRRISNSGLCPFWPERTRESD